MAYTYSPYEYETRTGVQGRPHYNQYEGEWQTPNNSATLQTASEWDIEEANRQRSQFQDYTGGQFKGLFDIVNQLDSQPNALSKFAAAPRYNPYGGTRADFTAPSYQGWGMADDGSETNWQTFPGSFDQQGYLDARFGNINDYLSNLGSFFGNLGTTGGSNERVQQDAITRANYAANLPQAGSPVNRVGVPQAGGLSGFSQAAPGSNYGGWGGRQVSGGWGSHPVAGGLLGFGGE